MKATTTILAIVFVVGSLTFAVGSAAAGTTAANFASEQSFSAGNDWEPYVAADPGSGYVYMVTTGLDASACAQCVEPSILLRVSPDGGATWGAPQFVCADACKKSSTEPWEFDPTVKVSANGTVFVAWLDGWNPGPVVERSYDHGRTWSLPVVAGQSGSGWADKPFLAVSPSGRDVYVAFNHGNPFVAASHDGGLSFGRPVRLTPTNDKLFYYPESGVVLPDGTVYFSMSVETAAGSGPVDLVVAKSSDGGTTWTIIPIDHSEEAPQCTLSSCITDEFQAQIVMDADAGGALLAVYMRTTVADQPTVLLSRASADGVLWSAPTVINSVGDSDFPTITHGPTSGDFRIAWQDNRNGPNAWNTFFSRTTDGGRHWSAAVLLSNLGTGAPYKTAAGYLFPYGDYFGITATPAGANVVIWGEGTGRSTFGGSWFTVGS